jgi:hypothetical protein
VTATFSLRAISDSTVFLKDSGVNKHFCIALNPEQQA